SEPYDGQTPLPWPADLPAIADLPPRDFLLISILEGEWVLPIYDLFSRQKGSQYFQDGEATYYMHVRPLLPHETPIRHHHTPFPVDYAPVLDCEGEPALISP